MPVIRWGSTTTQSAVRDTVSCSDGEKHFSPDRILDQEAVDSLEHFPGGARWSNPCDERCSAAQIVLTGRCKGGHSDLGGAQIQGLNRPEKKMRQIALLLWCDLWRNGLGATVMNYALLDLRRFCGLFQTENSAERRVCHERTRRTHRSFAETLSDRLESPMRSIHPRDRPARSVSPMAPLGTG